jgi:alpha-N-arabinofuranosidase
MVAALTDDHKFLTLAVVNATDGAQRFDLNVGGVRLSGPSTAWQMTGSSLDAENHVNQPAGVEVKEIAVDGAPRQLSVAPFSVDIFRFPVARPSRR